jgi:hypothetical protein
MPATRREIVPKTSRVGKVACPLFLRPDDPERHAETSDFLATNGGAARLNHKTVADTTTCKQFLFGSTHTP